MPSSPAPTVATLSAIPFSKNSTSSRDAFIIAGVVYAPEPALSCNNGIGPACFRRSRIVGLAGMIGKGGYKCHSYRKMRLGLLHPLWRDA